MSKIADIIGEWLYSDPDIAAIAKAVRPINLGATDKRPCIVYETVSINQLVCLNQKSGAYEATIRFHIIADLYNTVATLSDLVRESIHGESIDETDGYIINAIIYNDENDIAQEIDEQQKPFYVKALDFNVMANKV